MIELARDLLFQLDLSASNLRLPPTHVKFPMTWPTSSRIAERLAVLLTRWVCLSPLEGDRMFRAEHKIKRSHEKTLRFQIYMLPKTNLRSGSKNRGPITDSSACTTN